MNREQKMAWLILGVVAVAILLFLALIPLLGKGALGALGLFGLAGLGPLIFRKGNRADAVAYDERDLMIARKASIIGAIVSFETFVLWGMGTWFVYFVRGRETISVHTLPLFVLVGGMSLMISRSIAILVLYGRESKGEEKSEQRNGRV